MSAKDLHAPKHVRIKSTPHITPINAPYYPTGSSTGGLSGGLSSGVDDTEDESHYASSVGPTGTPGIHKQMSSPLPAMMGPNKVITKFGYITDDTDDSYDGHSTGYEFDNEHTPMLKSKKFDKKDHIEIIQIQSKLKKWIANQCNNSPQLILTQFIELMKYIAPTISTKMATDIFNQVDINNNGQVSTKLLLSGEFLPRQILKLFRGDDDEESWQDEEFDAGTPHYDNDEDPSAPYLRMDKKQLYKEVARLTRWIEQQGMTAIERNRQLERQLQVYQNEQHSMQQQQQEHRQTQLAIHGLQRQLLSATSGHNVLEDENRELIQRFEATQTRFTSLKEDLKNKERELKSTKKLSRELQQINDKYLKKNQELDERNKELMEETQELRAIILELQNEAMQYYQEAQANLETMHNEMHELKTEVDAAKVEVEDKIPDDDIRGITGNMQQTLHINRDALSGDGQTLDSQMELSRGNSNQSGFYIGSNHGSPNPPTTGPGGFPGHNRRNTLQQWFSMHSIHAVQPQFADRASKSFRQFEDQSSNRSSVKRGFTIDLYDNFSGGSARLSMKDENTPGPDDESEIDSADEAHDTTVIVVDGVEHQPDELPNDTVDALFAMGRSWKSGLGASNLDRVSQHSNRSALGADDIASHIAQKQSVSVDITKLHRHHQTIAKQQGDIFEEALKREIKMELTQQIRQELLDDFNLKLAQKDIANKLKVKRQQDAMKVEKAKLVAQYEAAIRELEEEKDEIMSKLDRVALVPTHSAAMRELNQDLKETRKSSDWDYHAVDDYKINDQSSQPSSIVNARISDRPSIVCEDSWKGKIKDRTVRKKHRANKNYTNTNCMEKFRLDFHEAIEKLFAETTIMWTLPLIK